jgi:hypothetical protein
MLIPKKEYWQDERAHDHGWAFEKIPARILGAAAVKRECIVD